MNRMTRSLAYRRSGLTALPLLLVALPFLVTGLPAARSQTPHTRIALLAEVASVRPGMPFTAGVMLRMDEGWHTYWQNPGESGLPTELRWTLPQGFTAGPPAWPLPEKKIEEGDLLTFGYSGEAMVFVTITPPVGLQPGSSVTLRVDASWLECERTCVPGEGNAVLVLPVGDGEPAPAHAGVFDHHRRSLPLPSGAAAPIRITPAVFESGVMLRVAAGHGARIAEGALPDFFPYSTPDATVGRTAVTLEGDEAVITVPVMFTPDVPPPATVHGVVVYTTSDGERRGIAYAVDLQGGGSRSGTGLLDRDFAASQHQGDQPSLLVYALFAIAGGLLLNIMPCVLPVIALKIFGLVKMAGDEPRRVRRLGWAFSAGILASFIVLALLVVLLKLAGQQVGWGFQFQEPVFVIIMSAVVFAFGLSLFGVFEIRLPGSAVAGVSSVLAKQGGQGKGYAASFSEGVFATILATPCTAPFLGSALGFAFAQPAGGILLIFSLAAFGMALPYLILTARPAWLKYMPKPGAWMETAKQFMGFLMMATLLWLLYILGKQLGMEAVIWSGAFLLVVALAAWLVGRFATLSAARRVVFTVWAAAVLLIAGGYWYFIEATLDVRAAVAGTPDAGTVASAEGGIAWEPFSIAALEQHLQAGRPVFLDFTAEWCLTCKVNERTVLRDPAVVEQFRTAGIVAIKADWTNRNPDITRLLSRFGRSGVPLYVVFPAGDPARPVILPEIITPGIVLDALRQAAGEQAAGTRSGAPAQEAR